MTTLDAAFYDLTQNTQGAFFMAGMAVYHRSLETPDVPPPSLLQVRRGYAESPVWLLVQASEFDPEPLSVERLLVRAVWSSPRIMGAILEMMAGEMWFDRIGEDYHLTGIGRELIRQRRERMENILSCVEPLPLADLERLEMLLGIVLNASLASDNPPGTWSLVHSLNRAPSPDTHPLVKIAAHSSDLNAFRDDCHMAAFRPLDIPAYMWETLSLIWQGAATTPDAIYEELYYRGYTCAEFEGAFAELEKRSWIKQLKNGSKAASITDEGRRVREEAERLTDVYFYTPWSVLSDDEIGEVESLLLALQDASNIMMEQA